MMAAQQMQGQPGQGQQQPAPTTKAPVPNEKALNRQSAQQEPDPLGNLNAYGNKAQGAVTYSELYGQGGTP